jgi:hypothetical protein
MSSIVHRREAAGMIFNSGLVFNIMTVFLLSFAVTLVLVHAAAPFVAPATDLDFLVLAYG